MNDADDALACAAALRKMWGPLWRNKRNRCYAWLSSFNLIPHIISARDSSGVLLGNSVPTAILIGDHFADSGLKLIGRSSEMKNRAPSARTEG